MPGTATGTTPALAILCSDVVPVKQGRSADSPTPGLSLATTYCACACEVWSSAGRRTKEGRPAEGRVTLIRLKAGERVAGASPGVQPAPAAGGVGVVVGGGTVTGGGTVVPLPALLLEATGA